MQHNRPTSEDRIEGLDDPLRAVRGIATGLVIAAAFWAGLLYLIRWA